MFSPKYNTYVDVRSNLRSWSTLAFAAAALVLYYLLIPTEAKEHLSALFALLSTEEWFAEVTKVVSLMFVFGVISFVLTELLRIHDRIYDKYIVRWREEYDVLFILPRLLQPFISNSRYRFFELAEQNRRRFMEDLFYEFVRDENETIPKNFVVRFYEIITKYWFSQMIEILLLILLVISSLLIVIYANCIEKTNFVSILALLLLLVTNRFLAASLRRKAQLATDDEIRAIHSSDSEKEKLRQAYEKVCRDYNI